MILSLHNELDQLIFLNVYEITIESENIVFIEEAVLVTMV